MVRSVTVFRDAALENKRLEEEAAAARAQSEEESANRSRERARVEADQRAALEALSSVLQALAKGQLNVTMRDDLPADFVAMALDLQSGGRDASRDPGRGSGRECRHQRRHGKSCRFG